MGITAYGTESRRGWLLVVVASVLTGFAAGVFISISTFLVPISAEFGWGRGDTSFAYLIGATTLAVGGLLMGYVADRCSARLIVLVGTLCLGGALLLLAVQTSLLQFYVFYGMVGLGCAALETPLLTNVGNWFERNKGLALGTVLAGRALGQGLVPFAAGLLIAAYGWREAYRVLAVASILGMLPLVAIVRDPPGWAEAKNASRDADAADLKGAYPVAPRIAVAWVSAAAVFCCICMGTAMVHAAAVAEDAGLQPKAAAAVILVMFVSGFFGRIAFGKLADHIGGIRAFWIASAGQTVLIFWSTQFQSATAIYLHAVVFGFFMSGVMTGLVVCARELTPLHMRGLAIGLVMMFGWIGMGIGGHHAGALFDHSGTYVLPYALAATAGVINVAIVGALYLVVRRRTASLPRRANAYVT